MVLTGLLLCATILLVGVTLLPLWQSPLWWVRGLEFPRLQILGLQALTLIGTLWHGNFVLGLALIAAMLMQAWHIWPFNPLAAKEMHRAASGGAAHDVRCLAMNVLMENTNHAAVLAEIARTDPDVLFLWRPMRLGMQPLPRPWRAIQPCCARSRTITTA